MPIKRKSKVPQVPGRARMLLFGVYFFELDVGLLLLVVVLLVVVVIRRRVAESQFFLLA